MSRKIHIFDTTLRDGEQVPGAKLNKRQKLEIAEQLARLGVDVIEAGFPCSSPEDFQAVKAVAEQVKGPIIAGLARAVAQDMDIAWEAVRHSERPRMYSWGLRIFIFRKSSEPTVNPLWNRRSGR